MIVSCRRSAMSAGRGAAGGAAASAPAALRGGVETGDRAQQLAAVAEQHAQLFEVLIGQIGQDAEINRVGAKCVRVLFQTYAG